MKKNQKYFGKYRLLFLSAVFITVGITVALYYNSRGTMSKSEETELTVSEGSYLSIGKLKQTLIQEGKKEWVLDANSADYNAAENKIFLTGLSMVFYMKNNTKALITADSGIMDNQSKNAVVSGNVTLKYEDISVAADELHYQHDKRLIFSHVPIKITGSSYRLTSDKISIDLETRKTVFEGNVNGFFSENIPL